MEGRRGEGGGGGTGGEEVGGGREEEEGRWAWGEERFHESWSADVPWGGLHFPLQHRQHQSVFLFGGGAGVFGQGGQAADVFGDDVGAEVWRANRGGRLGRFAVTLRGTFCNRRYTARGGRVVEGCSGGRGQSRDVFGDEPRRGTATNPSPPAEVFATALVAEVFADTSGAEVFAEPNSGGVGAGLLGDEGSVGAEVFAEPNSGGVGAGLLGDEGGSVGDTSSTFVVFCRRRHSTSETVTVASSPGSAKGLGRGRGGSSRGRGGRLGRFLNRGRHRGRLVKSDHDGRFISLIYRQVSDGGSPRLFRRGAPA